MNADLIRTFGRTLAETEWLRRKQLLTYQQGLLKRLLRHARDTTAYYKARLDFDCDSADAIERSWDSVPILTRIEANANREALMSGAVPPETGEILPEETSGSTGIPFEFLKSGLTLAASQALTERMFRWWSIDGTKCLAQIAYDRQKAAPPPDGLTTVGWHSSQPNGLKHSLDAAADTDVQLDWLRARRPDYLAAFSTNLNRLALRAIERRLDLRFARILSFGTRVDPDIRVGCRAAFGAEIVDSYGSQEVGHVATQCPDCGEYHLAAEASLIEILREDGRPAKTGQSGRLVATSFYNYAMPLIRYDMGDFAEAGARRPACGRSLPTLRRILGRARNRFRFRDSSVVWPELADFRLRDFIAYKDAQLLQIELDHIEVRFVPDGEDRPVDLAALTQRVREVLRQPVTVSLRSIERLGRITYGKIEDCVCLIGSA
jgi:phenylacetate-CoA ligase